MGETVVTTTGSEDPSVLAEAAVGAAAVAGAASVQASDAKETADEAKERAETALRVAASTPAGISPDEARTIAREEAQAYVAELAAAAAAAKETEPAPAPAVVVETTEVAPEVEPPSVKHANKGEERGKRRLIHRWMGTGDDD